MALRKGSEYTGIKNRERKRLAMKKETTPVHNPEKKGNGIWNVLQRIQWAFGLTYTYRQKGDTCVSLLLLNRIAS